MAFRKKRLPSRRDALKRIGAGVLAGISAATIGGAAVEYWFRRKKQAAEFEEMKLRFEEKGINRHADDWVKLSGIYNLSPDNEHSIRFAFETNRIAVRRGMEPAKVLLILEGQRNLKEIEITPELPKQEANVLADFLQFDPFLKSIFLDKLHKGGIYRLKKGFVFNG